MLLKRTQFQISGYNKLKSKILSLSTSLNKRYKLFPWRAFNSILSNKELKDEVIKINDNEYTCTELVKIVKEKNTVLKKYLKPSYYNYILNGFLNETNKKDKETCSLIESDYINQLDMLDKDAKTDLLFCLSALKEINNLLKNNNKKKIEINESCDTDYSINDIILSESDLEEVDKEIEIIESEVNKMSELDLRDYYLECYSDIVFGEIMEEGADKIPQKIKDILDNINQSTRKVLSNIDSKLKSKKLEKCKEDIEKCKRLNEDLTSISNHLVELDHDMLLYVAKRIRQSLQLTSVSLAVKSTDDYKKLDKYKSPVRVSIEKLGDAISEGKESDELVNCCKDAISLLLNINNDSEAIYVNRIKEIEKSDKQESDDKEYKEAVLSIYSSCKNGEITIDEREEMLATLNNERFIKECGENTECSKKEKFDKVVKELYRRCANGEFDVDKREELISKARDMIYGVVEVKDVTPTSAEPNDVKIEDTETDTRPVPAPMEVGQQVGELVDSSAQLAKGISNIKIPT